MVKFKKRKNLKYKKINLNLKKENYKNKIFQF